MSKLVLIDADGLLYHSSKETLEESIQILDEKIQNIFDKTEVDYYLMFVSLGRYFRHEISPLYKASRGKYGNPLLWIKTLKYYLIEKYGAVAGNRVEADDMIALFHNKDIYFGEPRLQVIVDNEPIKQQFSLNPEELNNPIKVDKIISSPDKDILRAIKGKHFNYSYRLEDKNNPDSVIKGWWVETSLKDSYEFKRFQLITGDSTDGISGLVGKGKAFFNKMTDRSYSAILSEYIKQYGDSKGIYEFQLNYRLLHLLDSDEDFIREVGYVPALPEVREVNKQQVEPNNIDF